MEHQESEVKPMRCPRCGGRGLVEVNHPVIDDMDCPICGGSGVWTPKYVRIEGEPLTPIEKAERRLGIVGL